jgi:hypothetical protein
MVLTVQEPSIWNLPTYIIIHLRPGRKAMEGRVLPGIRTRNKGDCHRCGESLVWLVSGRRLRSAGSPERAGR